MPKQMKVQTDLKTATDLLSFVSGTSPVISTQSQKDKFSSSTDTAKNMLNVAAEELNRRKKQSQKQLEINKKKKNNGSQKAKRKKEKKRALKNTSASTVTSQVSQPTTAPTSKNKKKVSKEKKKSDAKKKETTSKTQKSKKTLNRIVNIYDTFIDIFASPIVLGIVGFVFLLIVFISCCF
jgi:cobalamin biosynthesis Mg chelatase CobN